METYLEHYVLAGGWAMWLLLPASFLTVAVAVSTSLTLNRIRATDEEEQSPAGRIRTRLAQLHARHGSLSAEDVRGESETEALELFSRLQPLSAIAFLAPLTGLLGSTTALLDAYADTARRSATEFLAASVERALIPTVWGLGCAVLAGGAFFFLRAKVYRLETGVLRPVAEAAADRLLGRGSVGLPPGRGRRDRRRELESAGEEN